MKTDRTAVLWGTIIGITIVIVAVVVGFKFPYMRLPFTEWQQEALLNERHSMRAANRLVPEALENRRLLGAALGLCGCEHRVLLDDCSEDGRGKRRPPEIPCLRHWEESSLAFLRLSYIGCIVEPLIPALGRDRRYINGNGGWAGCAAFETTRAKGLVPPDARLQPQEIQATTTGAPSEALRRTHANR